LYQARDWHEAAKESRAMLALSPADLKARELLIKCELRLKNHEAALKEFTTLLEFDPPNRDQLIRQYPTLSRARGDGP
jgi:tetratricopeptide (TPR) repeat protein